MQLEWATQLLLNLLVLPVAFVIWTVVLPYLRRRHMRAADEVSLPLDECVACGSRSVELIDTSVIRCRDCAFVGGDGVGAWQRQRRVGRIGGMDADSRRAFAVRALEEARLALAAAQTCFDSVDSASAGSVVIPLGLAEGSLSDLAAGFRHLARAAELASDAAEALDVVMSIGDRRKFDQNARSVGFDVSTRPRGLAADLVVDTRMDEGRARLREMKRAVDLLQAQLTS